ncbi:hypothetical protein GCM10010464_72340 [Pseudonocardia yunnanensis]
MVDRRRVPTPGDDPPEPHGTHRSIDNPHRHRQGTGTRRGLPGPPSPTYGAGAARRYAHDHRGPLASNFGDTGGFLSTEDTDGPPDIQLYTAPTGYNDNAQQPVPPPAFTALVTLVAPGSRGRITLADADPTSRPVIDLGFYDEPSDFDVLLAGAKIVLEISRLDPLARFLAKPHLPASAEPTDTELTAHIRRWTQTVYHPTGTCAMGTHDDAVVDPALRVRGVDGLRVIDASTMPASPHGNTNAPTIMIAEKAADLIRQA